MSFIDSQAKGTIIIVYQHQSWLVLTYFHQAHICFIICSSIESFNCLFPLWLAYLVSYDFGFGSWCSIENHSRTSLNNNELHCIIFYIYLMMCYWLWHSIFIIKQCLICGNYMYHSYELAKVTLAWPCSYSWTLFQFVLRHNVIWIGCQSIAGLK